MSMIANRREVAAGLGATLLSAGFAAHSARAQGKFPSQHLRIIVPYPPGGPYDVIPRILAQYIGDKHGWTIIIENRPGASGITGLIAAKQMPPDGYTLVVSTSSTHGSTPAVTPNLRYDPDKDFEPVILLAEAPLALLVRSEIPVKSVAELLDWLKKNPNKFNYSSGGFGSQHHLATAMMFQRSGLPQDIAAHVPFQGLAPALNALVSGNVQFMFTSTGAATQFIQKGVLRALAVSSLKRTPKMPDVPAMAEAGFPGFNITPWCGLSAPAGTPQEIVAIWNKTINEALSDDGVRKKVIGVDYEPRGGSPEDYRAFFNRDIAQYKKLVKEANLKLK